MTAIDAETLRTFDPMDRTVQQCPFDHYAALREQGPVFFHERTGMWFVTRLDTMKAVLRDTTTFSSEMANRQTEGSPAAMARIAELRAQGVPRAETMLTCDPPRQTRYRKLVAAAFSVKRINELAPTVEALTDALIDRFPTAGRVDFFHDFAVPLPVQVIAHTLNMGPERFADIKRWSDDAVIGLGANPTDDERIAAAERNLAFQRYWLERIEASRAEPGDDIVSELVHAEFEDDDGTVRPLNAAEIISILGQLMVAGNETTTKLFNEGMRLLCEHPQWWSRLQADPGLVPAFVEEALRLSTPNQGMFRTATRDTEIEGVAIPKGSRLWVVFGAANRDERVFGDGESFDPTRANLNQHVAFGFGAHFCIGAPLSRLEARIGFERLLARLDGVHLPEEFPIEYEPSFILRGLRALDVVLTGRR